MKPAATTRAAAAVLSTLAGLASAGTSTIALDNTAVGGSLTLSFSPPVLNNVGQVAFRANTFNSNGIFLADGAGLSQRIAMPGDAVPGGGNLSGLSERVALSDAGLVSFAAAVVQFQPNTGIAQGGSSALSLLARAAAAAPGGSNFASFGEPGTNNAGQTAFRAGLASPVSSGLYLHSGGAVMAVALEGAAAPGGGNFTGFDNLAINSAGQLAFIAAQSDLSSGHGLYLHGGGGLTLLARRGAAAPGGGSFDAIFGDMAINGTGQVAFRAQQSDANRTSGLYLAGGGALSAVARQGAAAPGGGSFTQFSAPTLNAAGQVAFRADQSDPVDASGIYRASASGALTLVAREGARAPGGNGSFAGFSGSTPIIGSSAVLFRASLAGSSGGAVDDRGLYLGDGIDTVEVVREGRLLATPRGNLAVLDFAVSDGPDPGGHRPVNDRGQVSYQARFANGGQGIFVFTPELHYRRNFSSNWDGTGNWTLGLSPDAVHDVWIDPAADVSITGPAAERQLRSLTVGGGNGLATLVLAGGAIGTRSGLNVAATGVLTGTGVIQGAATNHGTVLARNLSFADGLANAGLLLGSTGLSPRVAGNLNNLATGEVRVGAGERLLLDGGAHTHAGRVEVVGGSLEINGSLASSGQINAIGGQLRFNGAVTHGGQMTLRDSIVRFNAGLANTGLLGLSFGTSDLFGTIVNQGGGAASRGRIIVSGGSNVTFYDRLSNNGELRVSAGAQAVFFGLVDGVGSFTGTGAKFLEGGFSPGLSPAFVELEGPVTLGISSLLQIELAGTTRITEPGLVRADGYDRIRVGGTLELLGGPLQLLLLDGFAPGAGSSFDILDWGTLQGRFGSVSLPGLAGGLQWDVSRLYLDGSVSVLAVPEPPPWALLLAGLAAIGQIARRQVRRASYRSRP